MSASGGSRLAIYRDVCGFQNEGAVACYSSFAELRISFLNFAMTWWDSGYPPEKNKVDLKEVKKGDSKKGMNSSLSFVFLYKLIYAISLESVRCTPNLIICNRKYF